jgi:hypothetical protein
MWMETDLSHVRAAAGAEPRAAAAEQRWFFVVPSCRGAPTGGAVELLATPVPAGAEEDLTVVELKLLGLPPLVAAVEERLGLAYGLDGRALEVRTTLADLEYALGSRVLALFKPLRLHVGGRP